MEQFNFIYNILNQKGIGRVKANKIIQNFKDELSINLLKREEIVKKLHSFFLQEQIEEIISNEKPVKLKIDNAPEPFFINKFHEDFPEDFHDLGSHCPPIISCIGNKELLKKQKVGFCGSRKASPKGIDVAKDITQQVTQNDIVVVSGYASGIDQETHYWALKEEGSTIIVLPEGIENFKIKKQVKDVWNWERVLVISEFQPNAIWSVSRAMERNTTIISLSDIMFLIEAKRKGGSIDAGYKTLKMNKPLFAPIYNGMPEEASGNEHLLTKGAHPLRKKRETNRANLDKMFALLDSIGKTKKTLF